MGIVSAHPEADASSGPRGTFRIEEVSEAEGPADWTVATKDPAQRARLTGPHDAMPHTFYISPDDQWIFATVHEGSGMGGAKLFRRRAGVQFGEVMGDLTSSIKNPIWDFFEKHALGGKKGPFIDSPGVGIVDFVVWSADSARLLLALRTGEREGKVGFYRWYLYYNQRRGAFELTDYLRGLNRNAPKLWGDDDLKKRVAPAASAEPIDPLPPEPELRARYAAADRKLSDLYRSVVDQEKPERREALQNDQRTWLKLRSAGADGFAVTGAKSERTRRKLQYLLDASEARMRELGRYQSSLP